MNNKAVICGTSLLILSGILVSAFSIQQLKATHAIIYIKRDGSLIDPTGMIKRMGNYYIFSGDIADASIRVHASNIVIHGSNHKLGAAACIINEPGIWVQNHSVTITNLNIERFSRMGIHLDGANDAHNCNISMCNIWTPNHMKEAKGILLSQSSNNNISRNVLSGNVDSGIHLDSSSGNIVSENRITASNIGINVSDSSNNRIDGNDIKYNIRGVGFYSCSNNYLYGNHIIDNHYGVSLYNSSNNYLYEDNTIAINNYGIHLEYSLNNQISGNNITDQNGKTNVFGVYLYFSSGNNVSENSIKKCYIDGVELWASSNNTVSGNNLTQNGNNGVRLFNSSGNTVSENSKITGNALNGIILEISSNNSICGNMEIADNGNGVYLSHSSGNTVSENSKITGNALNGIILEISSNNSICGNMEIADNGNGVYLSHSSGNIISENTLLNSRNAGMSLLSSSGNTISGNTVANSEIIGISLQQNALNNFIYHNDLVNKMNVYTVDSVNVWDNGTLNQARLRERVEGNYWVNYNGIDADGDEIGDIPLVIDDYNTDNCPRIAPKRPIPFFCNSVRYDLRFRANITVSMLDFNHNKSSINFDISLSMSGYCNVTFPSDCRSGVNLQLLKGRFKVLVANMPVAYILYWNKTHTSICFKVSIDQFDDDPPYQVSIQGEIATPLLGDINMDCCVDIYDVVLVSKDFGKKSEYN